MNTVVRHARLIDICLLAFVALALGPVARADELSKDQLLLNRLERAAGVGGNGFQLRCHTQKAKAAPSAPVVIRIIVENKSEVEAKLTVPVGTRGFGCCIFFGGKERVGPTEMGKLYFGDELSYFRPTYSRGQTDERELEINKLFEMSRPGKYLVFATLRTMTSQIGELVAEPIEIEILDP